MPRWADTSCLHDETAFLLGRSFNMPTLDELLGQSAALHHHLCPRQVLGVRMGLLAGRELGLDLPQTGKRLLTIIETDGCFADGVSVATGCWVGHRTLRVEDYGKVAATFVDTDCRQSVRIVPHPGARAFQVIRAGSAQSVGSAVVGLSAYVVPRFVHCAAGGTDDLHRSHCEPGRSEGRLRYLRRGNHQWPGDSPRWKGVLPGVSLRRILRSFSHADSLHRAAAEP